MFIKICIERLCWNHCRDNKFVLNAIYSLNLGLWTLLKIPSKHPSSTVFYKDHNAGFTAISKIHKIRELWGNLKSSLIFTKNQGTVRESGTASGIFHCIQGIFREESAPFVFKCDTWKRSPNLGWLWFPLSLNILGKCFFLKIIESVNLLESPCISWKLELCLKYFLLFE